MHINKPSKIVLGIFTFLPLILWTGAMVFGILQLISLTFSDDPSMPMMFLSYLGYIIPYLFFFFLFYLGLGVFYLIHIVQSKSLDNEKKFLWIVILFILNVISVPVYWYLHIWKDEPPIDYKSDATFDPKR